MGSHRGLLVLSMIAALLGVAVVLDHDPRRGPVPRSLRVLPELLQAEVVELHWQWPGKPDLIVAHGEAGLELVEPVSAQLDPVAVEELLGTLRLLSYRRHVADFVIESPRGTVELALSTGRKVTLAVGEHNRSAGQVWLARSDHAGAYAVDAYPASVLLRGADSLRAKQPLPAPDKAVAVTISAGERSLVLSGRPLAVHLPGLPGAARIGPGQAVELLASIDQLQVVRFGSTVDLAGQTPSLRVVLQGRVLQSYGSCGDALVWTESSIGVGCVSAAQLDTVRGWLASGLGLVDRQLLSISPRDVTSVKLPDMSLTRAGAVWRYGPPGAAQRLNADPAAVQEWLGELAELAGDPVPVGSVPGTPLATLVFAADGRSEPEVLAWYGGHLRRGQEPVWFPVEPAAGHLFSPDPLRFRSRDVVVQEPFSLVRVRRGSQVVERGELVDDWHFADGGAQSVDREVLEALRLAVSRLRAVRWTGDDLPRGATAMEVEFAAGPRGEPRHYRLIVGPLTERGCKARLAGEPVFVLDAETCGALLAPWGK